MADEREQIRSRIDIVDLVSQRVKLKKSGKNWSGLCPFHEDRNPSFSVSPDIGRYKCWSCDAAGDIFDWVMNTQGVEFREALEILAKQAGVELTQHSPQDKTRRQGQIDAMGAALKYFRDEYKQSDKARKYCEARGLPQEVLDHWEIGYAPHVDGALASELKKKGYQLSDCKELFLVDGNDQQGYHDRFRGRLIFPIHDDQGHLVAFGGRIIGDGQPKYINSSDTPLYSKSRVLYGMDKARDTVRKLRQAVLVEGYLDVIACHRAGVTNAIATLGTSLAEPHVKRLALWCDEVVVLYDSDQAGQRAAQRATEMFSLAGIKVTVALIEGGKDPDTVLNSDGPEAVKRLVENRIEPIDFMLKQIDKKFDVEQQQYWDEAARALASLPNQLELERHLLPLAGKYPFMRDPERAAKAIKAMVGKARRSMKSGHEERAPEPAQVVKRPVALPPPIESAPFRALAEDLVRDEAWRLCLQEDLFITESGVRLSKIISSNWPDAPPVGTVANLLEQLNSDAEKDLLSAIFMKEDAPLGESGLVVLEERLVQRRNEIALKSSVSTGERTDEDLMRLDARLKELKGVPVQENSSDTTSDPFV